MKKINSSDITQVVRKNTWQSGTTYDMWRNDITIDNQSQPSGAADIYSANYYVMNSDFRVYICLFNNANPENSFEGGPSLMNQHLQIWNQELLAVMVMDIFGNIFTPLNLVSLQDLTPLTICLCPVIGQPVLMTML